MNDIRVSLLLILLVLGGCTSSQREQIEQVKINQAKEDRESIADPFEGVNRVVWDFNRDVLDRFILKPITQGYVYVTPQPIRTGLLNAAENIGEPATAINSLLQGKPSDSFASASRFVINSTVGILGIFDVAKSMGIERKEEEFTQVLGSWSIGTGPYLMLPVFGPSDVRNFVGSFVDRYYWPETVLEDPYTVGAAVVRLIETRAALLEQEANLERSLDQYLFVRDAYFQRSAFELSDGKLGQKTQEELEEEADDFADFEALLEGTE
ncbi:VacJ family lipoprotein [Glaciecola siphonariae]|uniref:VacJ family lipoprotein n=1 Tax=Glaciecola siphonariae TaxID=521012 RepID=A0ABV9LU90_9ALTE